MAAKQKILIVDDDNNIAELISLYLTKECFDTKIVNDGEEALKAFEQYSPNLILLDLMLPGIDGYQVCRDLFYGNYDLTADNCKDFSFFCIILFFLVFDIGKLRMS